MKPTREVDCLGMRCPLPIIVIAKEILNSNNGELLRLLSDDPATWPDLQAWSRMTGNTVSRQSETNFIVVRQNQSGQDSR